MFSWDVCITFGIIIFAFVLVVVKVMRIKKSPCAGCEKKCLNTSKTICHK